MALQLTFLGTPLGKKHWIVCGEMVRDGAKPPSRSSASRDDPLPAYPQDTVQNVSPGIDQKLVHPSQAAARIQQGNFSGNNIGQVRR